MNDHCALGYWRDNEVHTDNVWSKGHLTGSVRSTEGRISLATVTSCIGKKKLISEYIILKFPTHCKANGTFAAWLSA